jgi:hypothetical protein
MMVRGSVDVLTSNEVIGWAFSPGRRDPVLVQAVLNHEILGETTAGIHRPDLAAAGLGDGNSGYVIKLFRPIDPLYFPFIVVKVDGGDAELPRAPTLGFGDFFRSLFVTYPAAGRSRSVFGGLWTDRTDAAALLRGKTGIGQIAPETVPAIEHLIHDGFAIIDLRVPPAEQEWRASLSARIADMLEDEALLPVLRAVLEDNPLVVKADWVADEETALAQPSAANPSPSPAECVEIVVPFGEDVVLDVVRDSHRLPEFTPHGVSRWASRAAGDGVSVVGANGLLGRLTLPMGSAALVGPGTLYQVRRELGSKSARLLCLAERGFPLALAAGVGEKSVWLAETRVSA